MSKQEGRATWFAYCPHGGGFINFAIEREARDEAERLLDEQRDEAPDGWSEATDQICWGRVHGEVEEVERRERTDSDRVSPDCDEIVAYELVDIVAPSPDLAAENERLREALRTVDARLDNLGLEADTLARRTIAAALEPRP